MRIVKTTPEGIASIERMQLLPEQCRPRRIVVNDDSASYDFVVGVEPTWREVHDTAAAWLWGSGFGPVDKSDVEVYKEYVIQKSRPLGLYGIMDDLLCRLRASDLHHADFCHHDLTLKNCVKTPRGVVFLDPGVSRGLDCIEIDEAKLLQSLDGFDCVYLGHPSPPAYPRMCVRRCHYILLATHYIRLLHHVKDAAACSFARRRIMEIHGLCA